MKYQEAFSLTEVAMALGICAFVLIAMLGLFQVGLQSGHEAEQRIQAANLASRILTMRAAAPVSQEEDSANQESDSPIPVSALTNSFATVYTDRFVSADGKLTTDPAAAVFRINCQAGSTTVTGLRAAQVYLALSWPPHATSSNASGRYETLSCFVLE